jgi:outer membrane protein assembly factor BamB
VNRRRFLEAVGTVGVGTALAGCNGLVDDGTNGTAGGRAEACGEYAPTVLGTAGWRTASGDPAGTGVVPADSPPDPPLTDDWTFPIDGVSGTTRPVVTSTRVFTHEMDATFYAVDSGTGDRVWSRTIDEPRGSPAATEDTVVLIRDGRVIALDAREGRTSWTGPEGYTGLFWGSPVIHDGVAYVPFDLSLYALDLDDGSVRWKHTSGHETVGTPALVGDTVFYGDTDTYLYALDAETGEERWRFKTAGSIKSNVSVAADAVFFASEAGTAYGVERKTGSLRWEQSVGGETRTVASDGAHAYVGTEDRLYAFRSSTGTECWSTGGYAGAYDSGLAAGDGRVYVPKKSGRGSWAGLMLLDAATGERRWATDYREYERGTDLGMGPVVVDGAVYATGGGAKSLALVRLSYRSSRPGLWS